MQELGKIQAEVMNKIRKASEQGNGLLLAALGPIAGEMERMGQDWESRLKHLESGPAPARNGTRGPATTVDFTGKRISAVTILGQTISVGSYKDALIAVATRLQATHPDFDFVAPNVRGRLPYFSENEADLRHGERLKNSRLYIETHNSAPRQCQICTELVKVFGHDPNDPSVLHFEVEPIRTRARKGSRFKG
jgi:hypothetical protein